MINRINALFGRKEQRSGVDSWAGLSGFNTAPSAVNTRLAENLSAVFACVTAISSAIASLPVYIYRWERGSRLEDDAHPLTRLINAGPNRWQTWPDFTEWLMASTLLRGNGLAEVIEDRSGIVTELRPIPWEWVSVQLLPSGRLVYDVTEITSVYGGQGRMRRLLQEEVLHLKDRSDDGLLGRSRLQRAASVVSTAIATQDFSASMWANGAHPSGVLQAEGLLTEDQLNQLREQFRAAFTGPKNAAKALVLDQGIKWESVSVSPEDAELLASRRFTVEELARLYQVPPPIIGDLSHGSFTNAETVGRWFAQQTLSHWIRKLETEFLRSVFSESDRQTHEITFDLSGLLRGDPETRWKSHEIAVKNNILTTDEIREVEGWNPKGDRSVTDPAEVS